MSQFLPRASRKPTKRLSSAIAAAIPVALSSPAPAEPSGTSDPAPPSAHAEDKSGTNPADFSRMLQARSEYYALRDGEAFGSLTEIVYSQPIGTSQKIEIEAPLLVGTDATGPSLWGTGDVSVAWKARPYQSRSMAIVAGAELFAPTGTRDELSANRWLLGPMIAAAFFFPERRLIFAPTYQQKFSLSGREAGYGFAPDDDLNAGGAGAGAPVGSVNVGTFDFYVVYRFADGKRWLTIDPAITIDYADDNEVTASIAPAFGTFIAPGRSVTVQPVIPLTSGTLDWGVKVTFKAVY